MNILNIEKTILSTILFEPEIIDTIELEENDFNDTFHKKLFKTIISLKNKKKPFEIEFVKKEFGQNFDEEKVIDIISTTPISNIFAYIEEIKIYNKIKHLKQIAYNILKEIENDNSNIAQLTNYIETEISNLQKNNINQKDIFLSDLLNEKEKKTILHSTGIDWLDEIFDGGIELGQLITITGEQEAGKTQLINQILFNISNNFKSLYFSLEFNKRQLINYTKKKKRTCKLSKKTLNNIIIITDENTTGDINDIIWEIKQKYKKYSVKFVFIDSLMMLQDDLGKFATMEEKISSIFQKLHHLSKQLDICIFLIAQSSKEDHKTKKIEIFGSKKAAHLANIMIHIFYDKNQDAKDNKGKREIFIAKNKQNGKITKIDVFLDKEKLEFFTKDNLKNDQNNLNITILEDEDEIYEETIEIKEKLEELSQKGFNFE